MPIFTITFCALIFVIFILDNFIIIPKTATVTLKEKLWSGHNKGYINHALHLSEKKIKKGFVKNNFYIIDIQLKIKIDKILIFWDLYFIFAIAKHKQIKEKELENKIYSKIICKYKYIQ